MTRDELRRRNAELVKRMSSTKEDLEVEFPIVCDQYEECVALLGGDDPDCVLLHTIKSGMEAELALLCGILGG